MSHLFYKVALLVFSLSTWLVPSLDAEPSASATSIPYRDIGPKYFIEGKFGPLYTDLTIKAVVLKPLKGGESEENKIIWLNITHLNGKALNPTLYGEVVFSDSKFAEGTEVELVIREEGRLVSGDSIDLILSNPDRGIKGKMVCVLSLHQRQVVTSTPPK